MAGGTWVSQNKVRPGAYINFKAVNTPEVLIGSRGIATLALELDWGNENKLIDLYSTDLVDGNSLAKVGLTAYDSAAKLLNLVLSNAYLCKVYRLNKNGVKATATLGDLKVTAKYNGIFGNKIAILIKRIDTSIFDVTTYANGYEVDTQRVSGIADLENNEYVIFEPVSEKENPVLAEQAETLLTGGTNGTAEETAYSDYLKVLKTNKWQTLAVTNKTNNTSVISFIKDMRENEGKYVQAVIAESDDADYEGIINNINGVVLDEETITPEEFTSYVAGITAGAGITLSNTGKIIEGATEIIGALDNREIIEALNSGKFVLSLTQQGAVKVEKDINSLHTFSKNTNKTFSKNRIIRTLDEIGSTIVDMWETTYLGKVSNTDGGRTMFKSSIIEYLSSLQTIDAIQDFNSSSVEILAGDDIDSVIANIAVKPVDSMEFLYMTVNVN